MLRSWLCLSHQPVALVPTVTVEAMGVAASVAEAGELSLMDRRQASE